MTLTSSEQAVAAAGQFLESLADSQRLQDGDRYVVLSGQVSDCGSYWRVPYQSASFVESGRITDMLTGNWPLAVSKEAATVIGVETPEWAAARASP